MGVVQFNSTDRAQASTLASALANTTGAKTVAALVKRDATGTDYDAVIYTKSGTSNGTTEWGLSFKDTNLAFVDKGATTSTTANTFTSTTAPIIIVAGRGAGAAQALSYSYYNRISEAGKSVTGVASTDVFTSSTHGYANGDEVWLSSLTGGAGLTATRYFIIAQATSTFQLATTVGGSAVNFTTDLSAGTVTRTGHWTHDGTVGTLSDGATATMLEIGAFETTGDFLRAHFGLGGFWASNLSQANREVLSLNWRTTDWYTNPAGAPVALIEGNTATPTDLIGNATNWAYTGLTLDGAETLLSFTFDGTGGSGDAGATSPAAIALGDAPVPAASAGSTVTTPVADALGDAPAPASQIDMTVTTGPASATGSAPVPAVSGAADANTTTPVADALGDAPVPAATASSNVTTPAADATGTAPAPSVSATSQGNVTTPAADALADAPDPVIHAGATITAPAADATGDAPAPTDIGAPAVDYPKVAPLTPRTATFTTTVQTTAAFTKPEPAATFTQAEAELVLTA